MVTVSDSFGDNSSASSSLNLGNREPTSPTVSLSPDPVYLDGTITCTVSNGSDPDGDSVSYSYVWEKNGDLRNETGNSLSGFLNAGDSVSCTVTPSDGILNGTAVTKSISIANQAPIVDSISLSPDPVYSNSTITASVVASDLENDTMSYTYVWSVNTSLV